MLVGESEANYTVVESTVPVGSALVTVTSASQTLRQLLTTASATLSGTIKRFYFRIASGSTVYWGINRVPVAANDVPIVGPAAWDIGCDNAHVDIINFIAGGNTKMEVNFVE